MNETNWTPAVTVLLVGLGLGIVFAVAVFVSRRRARAASKGEQPASSRLDDLRVRRDQLLSQLREHADMGVESKEDRAELEKQAALVMREISELEAAEPQGARAGGGSGPRASSPSGSELRGAIKAVVAVAVVGAIGYAVWQAAAPRKEGAPVTGNIPAAPANEGGMLEGHPTSTEANPILAKDTPRLKKAREALTAKPDSVEAQAELGYALAEAGGWIEVFQNAQRMLSAQPDQPDALIQLAMVRFAMGQVDDALNLIDQVLQSNPDNARALEVGGRIAHSGKKWRRALVYLETALAKIGPGTDLDALVESAKRNVGSEPEKRETTPATSAKQASPHGAGTPAPPSAGKPPASALGISGTISLAPGTKAPAGAVLYVMARAAGSTSGAPLAVERLQPSSFPATFTLAQSHGMSGEGLPSKVTISARLDVDGNVATRQSGDLAGHTESPVALDERAAQIVLAPAKQ